MAIQRKDTMRLAKALLIVTLVFCAIWFAASLTTGALAQSVDLPALRAEVRQSSAAQQQKGFTAAGVSVAGDLQYPLNTTAEGAVVCNVSLDEQGRVTGVTTLAGAPPLRAAAESSLRSWTFTPAVLNGMAQPSQMLVAFVFRHAVQMASKLPPITPVSASKGLDGYASPGIRSAAYADYPTSTVAAGAFIVEDSLQPDGSVAMVRILRDMSGEFAPLVLQAAERWSFEPAMLNGAPVPSRVAIAFVFSSRALNPF